MRHKLLLADDSITIQKVVELVLAEEDFEIKSVGNGEDAFNAMETFRPDIVLADIEMPKMNGYELCEKIKNSQKFAGVPVILLAGAFEPLDEDLVKKVGADDSVIKPFESQELISKINVVLTMGAGGEVAEVAEAVEEEEAFEVFEEAEGIAETVELADSDEDLWSLEEEVEATAETAQEVSLEAEAAVAEPFDFAEEIAVEEPVAEAVVEEEAPMPVAQRAQVTAAFAGPSESEMLRIFEKTVNEKVGSSLASMDIRETLMSSLIPMLKDSVDKVLWEIAPDLVEKMLREILKESVASLSKEVEKVIWETVPDLATSMISKEIEKIKSEF